MVELTPMQEELCRQSRWDFSDLRALFINCTLKRSPELSHTHGLAEISMEIMRRQGVTVDHIRAGGLGCRLPLRLPQPRVPLNLTPKENTVMTFIQQIDLRTTNVDEIRALEKQWRSATEGKRTLRRSIVAQDRNDSNHFVVLAFFDDYDSAMVNSSLPETDELAAKQGALLETAPTFLDLDVIDDEY